MLPPCDHTSGLFAPAKKEIAMQLISAAENACLDWKRYYDYIEYNVEENEEKNRGYTAGIIGFTSKTGDMLEVVNSYDEKAPGNLLTRYLPALRKVKGTSSIAGLGEEFKSAWKKSADEERFREAQNENRDKRYFDPAVCQAQSDGLRTLGQFIYYDAIVMHGSDEANKSEASFEGIRAAAIEKAKPPAQGGDETDYLGAFLDARKAVMSNEPDHVGNIDRVDTMQRTFLEAENLDLSPPLSFRVNNQDFEIPVAQPK